MKPKVYVETSVVSYLTAWPSGDLIIAARQKITRDWWRDAPSNYDLVASERVVSEASVGDVDAIQDRLAALQSLPLLTVDKSAESLAKKLMKKGAVPTSEPEDALHIALAAVNGIEYLVTWNFKHIANPTMRLIINNVCTGANYDPPTICTPEELGEVEP